MQISGSAFYTGLNTIQTGQQRIDQASVEIAGSSLARSGQADAQSRSNADIADDMVEMTSGKLQAEAGARVVETADDVLGTLIDIRA